MFKDSFRSRNHQPLPGRKPLNPNIKVASLSTATKIKRRFDAVLTAEDPGMRNGLRFHSHPHPDHLVLKFEDVDDPVPGIALPDIRHVEAAVAFGREHASGSVLVHCKAGVARSSALALALISDRLGSGFEREAVTFLLATRPVAVPNLLVLEMADRVLGRGGRLEEAWLEVERSQAKYAEHRALKRKVLERNPAMYARPMASLELSAVRCYPDTLVMSPGLLPAGEDAPANSKATAG